MQFAAHGTYSIEQNNNILIVDAQGPFNDVIATQYQQEMKTVMSQMHYKHWAIIIVYYGESMFTPEAEQALVEITQYRMEKGMKAVAAVIPKNAYSSTLYAQLKKVYQRCAINFQAFDNKETANAWLNKQLA